MSPSGIAGPASGICNVCLGTRKINNNNHCISCNASGVCRHPRSGLGIGGCSTRLNYRLAFLKGAGCFLFPHLTVSIVKDKFGLARELIDARDFWLWAFAEPFKTFQDLSQNHMARLGR